MAYADQTVLEDAYGADEIRQLADRDGIGIASPEVLARMQAQADDLIDRHLASAGYAVPVADPVPPTIIACSSAIQRYFLFDDGRPESVIGDFKCWMRWLEQVAVGKSCCNSRRRMSRRSGRRIMPLRTGCSRRIPWWITDADLSAVRDRLAAALLPVPVAGAAALAA